MSYFEGWYLKMGGDMFPHTAILADSWYISPNRRFDLDSTRNADGTLTRYVLDHTATTIKFDLRPLKGMEQEEVQNFIMTHYLNALEKKAHIQYWSPDISDYCEGDFYVPDVEWQTRWILNGVIWYRQVPVELIEY